MATIQKIKNKRGYSYRVLFRKKGYKTITKTFSSRLLASDYISSLNKNTFLKISYVNSDLTLNDLITEYLSNIYKGTRPKTERRRLQYWVEK